MNTDERAHAAISDAIRRTPPTRATVTVLTNNVLDALRRAGIELFEAAPAKEASQ